MSMKCVTGFRLLVSMTLVLLLLLVGLCLTWHLMLLITFLRLTFGMMWIVAVCSVGLLWLLKVCVTGRADLCLRVVVTDSVCVLVFCTVLIWVSAGVVAASALAPLSMIMLIPGSRLSVLGPIMRTLSEVRCVRVVVREVGIVSESVYG